MAAYKRKRVKVGDHTYLNKTISNKGVRTTSMSTSSKTGGTRQTVNRSLGNKPTKIRIRRSSEGGFVYDTTSSIKSSSSKPRKSNSSRSSSMVGGFLTSTGRVRRTRRNSSGGAEMGLVGLILILPFLWSIFEVFGKTAIRIAKWKSSNPNKELTFDACNFFEVLRLIIIVPVLAVVVLMTLILTVGIISKVV